MTFRMIWFILFTYIQSIFMYSPLIIKNPFYRHKNFFTLYDGLSNTETSNIIISPSERVVKASSYTEVLSIITDGSIHLPGAEIKHYETQYIHMKKRQSTCTNALKRISKFLIGYTSVIERQKLSQSKSFADLITCALYLLPIKDIRSDDVINYCEAIRSIGHFAPLPNTTIDIINKLMRNITNIIIEKAPITSLTAVETALIKISVSHDVLKPIQSKLLSAQLPFKHIHAMTTNIISLDDIKREIIFKKDELLTSDGRRVNERRETCWMAEPGIGGLAYSGKIMSPVSFEPCIRRVRDVIEEKTGVKYDCCLINWYADGECACKFHSDPDHGRIWALETIVVSVGETRRFNLREINADKSHAEAHHSFHVFDGDAFFMWGNCQDTFQHCVLRSEGVENEGPRASIVFKKSLPLANGRRGHGVTLRSSVIIDEKIKPSGRYHRESSSSGKKGIHKSRRK